MLKKFLIKVGKHLYIAVLRMQYGIQNKVLFISFDGRQYSDNPRAISEKLHEQYPEIQIVWIIRSDKKSFVPEYAQIVDSDNRKNVYKAYATSKVIVSNFSFLNIKKSKKQFFIQTWHGDRAFKKIQYDNPFIAKDFFRPESQPGFCDLCVAGSDYGERKFRSAFKYTGEIIKEGTPRDDRLVNFDMGTISQVKKLLKIPDETKILLYAPTIRKAQKNSMEVKELNITRTLEALEHKYNSSWVCFMRAHPGVKELSGVEYNDKIIDVSGYEDMADLLLVSDMLITDYSSCAGDFALLNRPLVLFHADKEEYISQERTFYFDIQDSPYWVAESQSDLERIIYSFSEQKIKKNCKEILSFYGNAETGNSSEKLASIIAAKMCESV